MTAPATKNRARVTLPTSTQILITREFDAPRRLVYEALTMPELIKRWWHANRGTATVAEVDLRVGGKWRYVMIAHGEFEVAFHEVVEMSSQEGRDAILASGMEDGMQDAFTWLEEVARPLL